MGWRYREARDAILSKFKDGSVEVTGGQTPDSMNAFEVQVVGGELLHSRRNGMGFVDTPEKVQAIQAGIEKTLKQAGGN